MMNKLMNQRPLVFSVVLHVLLFGLTYLLFTPQYMTNDDVVMMLLSSGKLLNAVPTDQILFSNVLIGKLMVALNTINNTIPWYPLYFIAALFTGHVFLLYLLLKQRPGSISLLFYLLYFITGGMFLLLFLQFTMVASFLSVAGILLLYLDVSCRRPALLKITGIVLLVVASLIRIDSLLLMVMIASPLWLIDILYKKKEIFSKSALCLLAALAVSGLLWGYSYSKYQEGNAHYHFNYLRAQFVDYGALDGMPKQDRDAVFAAAGWTDNDFNMLMNWFYMDKAIYSAEKLEQVLSSPALVKRHAGVKEIVNYHTTLAGRYVFLFGGCFLLLVLLVLSFRFAASEKYKYVLSALIAVLLLAIVQYFQKAPPVRVVFPVLLLLCMLPLFLQGDFVLRQRLVSRKLIFALPLLLIAVVLLYINVKNMMIYNVFSNNKTKQNTELKALATAVAPGSIMVDWGSGVPYENILPFDRNGNNAALLNGLHVFALGCFERTVDSEQRLSAWGITDLYTAMYTNKNIYLLVGKPQQELCTELYTKYVKEHYNKTVQPQVFKEVNGSVFIQFTEVTAP